MTDSQPRLFQFDGSAYIFRAYFALPPLNHSTGLPTHAIYGFTNLLIKFLKQYRPEYVAVVLDAGHETFRNQMFAAYKSNRPAPPADLIPQFPYFRRVLEGLKIALLELAGYEADDVIPTLCYTMAGNGCDLIVVSSDKDFMQLVTDGIKLVDLAKDPLDRRRRSERQIWRRAGKSHRCDGADGRCGRQYSRRQRHR
jgi:DNA polymerase I